MFHVAKRTTTWLMRIYSSICGAIRGRKVVRFRYDGGEGVVESHCHGISTAGNEVLRGFQTKGHSNPGTPTGWKLFTVAEMRSLVVTQDVFAGTRPQHNPNDAGMSRVCCHA